MTNQDLDQRTAELEAADNVVEKIFVTIGGQDWQRDLSDLGLSFDSSESEIMNRIVPIIKEEFGENISEYYKVRKALNSHNIFVIPNSTAG